MTAVFRRLAGALFALFLLAGPAAADAPVWRIKGDHGDITLFGSVHLLGADADWKTPALEKAMDEADQVWFETNLDAEGRTSGAQAALRLGALPAGKTLSGLLPKKGRERLARVAGSLGIPMATLEPLKPWYAEVVLSLADMQRQGAAQGLGVEEQVMARVSDLGRRRAFETPEEQIGMLASAPEYEQVAGLMQALEQIETEPDSFAELQKAWTSGDTAWIDREALGPIRKETPKLYDALVVERNRRWTVAIERLLKGPEKAFIVVGVGHLVGPDSVPAMLRAKGFVVEGP